MGLKIITWNINGLRSFGGAKNWRQVFADFNHADLICFQETKISRSSVEDWMACVDDYSSYFSFPGGELLNSGYSGVATYCRESSGARPTASELSLRNNCNEIFDCRKSSLIFDEDDEEERFNRQWPDLLYLKDNIVDWKLVNNEGRCVVTKHSIRFEDDPTEQIKFLYVINVYCPRNDQTRPERAEYQLRFYHMLEKRAFQLLNESENNFVIILGDFNAAHTSHDVYDDAEFCHAGSNSRKWISKFLTATTASNPTRKFIDAFRVPPTDSDPNQIPNQKLFTCWNTQLGCRITNFGSRIDYILIDSGLLPYLSRCYPMTDYMGSDHCPVVAEFLDSIKFTNQDLDKYSKNCTKLWPELSNKSLIRNYFQTRDRDEIINQSQIDATKPQTTDGDTQNTPKRLKMTKSSTNSDNQTSENKPRIFFQSFPTVSNRSKDKSKPKIIELSDEESSEEIEELSSQDLFNVSQTSQRSQKETNPVVVAQWKHLFRKEKIPICTGHKLPCVRRTVKKDGPTKGREYYSCPKISAGPPGHPQARCNFFKWFPLNEKE